MNYFRKYVLSYAAVFIFSLAIQPTALAFADKGKGSEFPNALLEINKHRVGPISPTYNVYVLPDGRVIYRGIADVRLRGEHRYELSKDKFAQLLKFIDEMQFEKLKSYPDPQGHIADIKVSSKGGLTTKSFNAFVDPKSYFSIMRALENILETRKLRCPYAISMQGKTIDVCKFEQETESRYLSEVTK